MAKEATKNTEAIAWVSLGSIAESCRVALATAQRLGKRVEAILDGNLVYFVPLKEK